MHHAKRKVCAMESAGLVVLFVVALQLSSRMRAQDAGASAPLPRFSVVAVHPVPQGPHRVSMKFTDDGLSIEGAPLYMVMFQAFGVPNDHIFNAPEWTRTTCYDIDAKVDPADLAGYTALGMKQRWPMVLALLEERFGLKFHHETRGISGYALVVAKGGPKLKDAAPPDPNADPAMTLTAGTWRFKRSEDGYEVKMRGASAADIARMLSSGVLGKMVVDKTGLAGKYDVVLDYSEEEEGPGPAVPMNPTGNGSSEPSAPAAWPAVFTALEEQLGLKLEPEKEPADVIVIDHVEQPSAN
jgi:bla regulator protein blaR1